MGLNSRKYTDDMLPFNRQPAVTVGHEERDELLEGRSFLSNILEMSQHHPTGNGAVSYDEINHNGLMLNRANAQRIRRSLDSAEFLGISRTSLCVSSRLRLIFGLLRCLALFPALHRRSNRKRHFKQILCSIFLLHMGVMALLLNAYLGKMNFEVVLLYTQKFGLMHACTVSNIISGIKPMINVVVLFIFIAHIPEHRKLVKRLDSLDICFRSAFQSSPPLFFHSMWFMLTALMIYAIPLAYKIFEIWYNHERLTDTLVMIQFMVVPVLSLWNLIPLFYYHLHNCLVRHYCRVLTKALNREHDRRHFSLKFYYEQFLRICGEAIGELFNPFLLFSLFWSLVILCLSIYFVIQPASSLVEPLTEDQIKNPALRQILTMRVHTAMGWAALQVVVALLNIMIISHTGMKTNELTRQIVNSAVLRIVPDASADLDRFQISCFVHKLTTQFMWGMTVWRAFPLERSTFFTMVSVIITYSFLLLKLKENPAVSPIVRTINLTANGTAG